LGHWPGIGIVWFGEGKMALLSPMLAAIEGVVALILATN
jgi:hypothetical protein